MTRELDELCPRILPPRTRHPDEPAVQPRPKLPRDNHSKRIRQH